MKITRMTSILLIICILLLIEFAWLKTTSQSVLWSFETNGQVSRLPAFVLFNPFREKQSEIEAEIILQLIKEGQCSKITLELGDKDRYRSLCANFSDDNINQWKIVYREDKENLVTLFYLTNSVSEEEFIHEIGITLRREENQWKLVDIGPIY